jgi:predicted MFS family arabinose efflux permease
LTTTFPEGAARNRALGIFGAATAAGFVTGQVLGGVLTELAGWRSIFIINVPVTLAGAALALRMIPTDAPRETGRRPDVAGATLITGAMALAVWAPARGAQHGWTSIDFLAPLGAAAVIFAIFAIVESRVRDPLLRLSILRSRWLAGTNAATAVTGALNGAAVLLCTLYLQHVRGYTPLEAGLAFVPTGLAGLVMGTRYAGALVTRYGVRNVLTGAALVSAIAVGGLSGLGDGGGYLALLPWLIVIGASFTTAAVATTIAVATGVEAGEQGLAAALRQTAFQLGVAVGVAVLLSIAVSHTAALLAGATPPDAAAALTAGYRLALLLLRGIAAVGALVAATTLRTPRA